MNAQQRTLARRFLTYRFLMNLWFVEAIWVYFYRIFMTDAQIGALDAVAFAIGLLAEIPSGALADKFGRSRVVKIGIVLAAIGMAGQALGGYTTILFSMSLMMAGFALMSGADDALFYTKLNFKKDSLDWRKFISRSTQIAFGASIFAIPLGSFLYQVNHQLVFVLNGLAMLASGLTLLGIKDIVGDSYSKKLRLREHIREYALNISAGFKSFRMKELRVYIPIILTTQAVLYIFNWGLLKLILADRFHFSEEFGGILLGASCLVVVIVLQLMNRYAERVHERFTIMAIVLIAAAMLFSSIPSIAIIGVFVIIILQSLDGVLYPFLSEALNRHAPGEQRATVISVASFLKALPYILMAPFIGWLNTKGALNIFLAGWAILMILALIYYLSRQRKDTVLHVEYE